MWDREGKPRSRRAGGRRGWKASATISGEIQAVESVPQAGEAGVAAEAAHTVAAAAQNMGAFLPTCLPAGRPARPDRLDG